MADGTSSAPPERPPPARLGAGRLACLGGALVAGWIAHDLAIFLTAGEPAIALRLLPRSLLLIAAGALFGALGARFRWLFAAAAGLSVAAFLLGRGLALTRAQAGLLEALAALTVALFVAHRARRVHLGPLRLGLCAGVAAGVAVAWRNHDLDSASWLPLTGALIALLAGLVRRAGPRRLATLAALALPSVPIGREAWSDARNPRPDRPPTGARAADDAPNLVLIVLDTVRAHRLAPYGHDRVTTPNLDALVSGRGVLYANARSTSSWTLPSHTSLLTGLLPSEHGATHPRRGRNADTVNEIALPAQPLRADVPTLAEILRDAGYRTGAVLANNAYLDPDFHLDRGYEHYDARAGSFTNRYLPLVQLAGWPAREGHQIYRDARTITDLALAWLQGGDGRPFFLTLNYMDAHSPYLPPPPFDRAFGGQRVSAPLLMEHESRALQYDRSLLWLDSQLNRLLRALERDGTLERTVVIVTADHGEALGDHGFWMHNWTLYDELLRVPLYVLPAGPRPPEVREEPVTGADVFHIALRELGLEPERPPPRNGVIGEWYRLEKVRRIGALADKHLDRDLLAWLDGSRKLIVASTGEVEAYDLALDPGERAPIELTAAEVEAARERARAWWESHPAPEAVRGPTVSEEEIERLKGLGYLGGDG